MPELLELRLRTGQLVTENWYDVLYYFLQKLVEGGVIDIYGYVTKDLIPNADLLLNLGIDIRKFKELHAGWGYFTYNAWIGGHQILKDGDPITVEDLGSSAIAGIRTAIDTSAEYQVKVSYLGYQCVKLAEIAGAFIPVKLGSLWSQSVSPMTDFFSPDLTALADGRVRVKMTVDDAGYAYLKHRLLGEASDIIAALNAGIGIPANCWHEWDFTIGKSDKVNLRLDRSATVTVIMYNIPNA